MKSQTFLRSTIVLIAFASLSCQQKKPVTLLCEVRDNVFPITSFAVSPSEQRFATCSDRSRKVKIWDVRSRRQITEGDWGNSIAFWNEDTIAVTSTERGRIHYPAIEVLNWQGGTLDAKLPVALNVDASCLAIAANTRTLFSGGIISKYEGQKLYGEPNRKKKTIEVWSEGDVERFAAKQRLQDAARGPDLLKLREEWFDFNSNGDLSECDDDVNGMLVDQDGNYLIAVGEYQDDGVVERFDVREGKLLWRRTIPGFYVRSALFCNDSHSVAIRPDVSWHDGNKQPVDADVVRVLDVVTGEDQRQIHTGQPGIAAIAYSERLKILATGGNDGTIIFWRPDTGVKVATINTELFSMTAMTIIESVNELVVANKGGRIRFYKINENLK
jgi:WD40 repeat protein